MQDTTRSVGTRGVQSDAGSTGVGQGGSAGTLDSPNRGPDRYQGSKNFGANQFVRPPTQNTRLRRAIADALEKQRRGDTEPVSGRQWIARSQFSPLSSKNVRRRLLSRVREQAEAHARGEGPAPAVIFDLDHTVYDNADRMLKVLRDWTRLPAAQEFSERSAINALQREQICYGITESICQAGVGEARAKAITKSVLPHFGKQFFDNHNTLLDEAYAGVLEFIQDLVATGAKIVFLTGRCEDEQGPGTRKVLGRDGIGVDNETFYLFMKPTKYKPDGTRLSDEEYKRSVAPEIDAIGKIEATLDNEPANVAVFCDLYPDAMNIFAETAWSENPAPPKRGLYRIERYDD